MSRQGEIFVATALLAIMFALMITSAVQKSPTYDEQVYISRGYAFVKRGDLHILVGEPVLLNALNALPLLALPGVRLPTGQPAWAGDNFHPIAEAFMWQVNANADQMLFLARAPTMLLALLLAVFVYRWAREAFGRAAALLSLALCVFDPNLLAHGRLAATDLGSTALIFICTYWLWQLLRRPSWGNVLWSGFFFGLAQAARFSALLFAPGFALLFAARVLSPAPFALPRRGASVEVRPTPSPQPRWKRLVWLAAAGALIVLIGYATLWAVHGFQWTPVRGATTWPVPAASLWEQLRYISGRLSGDKDPVTGFLLGELYVGGKWQYFPVAWLLKTPLPTLALWLTAVFGSLRSALRRAGPDRRPGLALWLPPLLYFLITLNSKLNLGYRYILPVLPFAIVLAGRCGAWAVERISTLGGERRALATSLAALAVGWAVWSGIDIWPHYLAFFNELAGGPDGGWRYLVDSNLDWGQDLKLLKRWADEHHVAKIKLAYYGEGVPAYYGLDIEPQICSPDRWQHPLYHDLYFDDPAPGVYAISANLLQGRNLARPETYRWFRERAPVDKVGYSIFIYEVPRWGDEAVIALSGLSPPDIRAEDYALLGGNDVRVLWFDAARSALFPSGDQPTFSFVPGEMETPPALVHLGAGALLRSSTLRDGRPLRIFKNIDRVDALRYIDSLDFAAWYMPASTFAPGDPAGHGAPLGAPVRFGCVELLGYESSQSNALPGERLTWITYWRVVEPAAEPLTLFVHLLDAGGVNRAGEDRGDVWYDNWRRGDVFAQLEEIQLPAELAAGRYQVEIGWYTPRTMARLPVLKEGQEIADRILLAPVTIADR